ncbi:hypothetical protein NLX86_11315 [Streptomyces sp. A3M-1-3]|uniref:hypothetical protein n=1 Tax=Streptomyces sp. A3M-1-3 TaxID=2962044 RepID=UPI0020B85B18|nr:hypothetical protein [Streptomyces sp. A3M-1-3]MCP3818685.1 hypothetical protein [Streptomyces sp. A3M-1-3]
MKQLKEDTDKALGEIRAEVEQLKGRRLPLPTVGVLTGAVGAATGLIAMLC